MRLLAAAVAAAAILAAAPAYAQAGLGMSVPPDNPGAELSTLTPTHRYWAECLGADAEEAVHGCGRIIGARVSRIHTASAHYFRSIALDSLGEPRRARRDLTRAYLTFSDVVFENPQDAFALHGRGLALIRLGHQLDGQADIERANAISQGEAGRFFQTTATAQETP
jgi:hypothetical protein